MSKPDEDKPEKQFTHFEVLLSLIVFAWMWTIMAFWSLLGQGAVNGKARPRTNLESRPTGGGELIPPDANPGDGESPGTGNSQ